MGELSDEELVTLVLKGKTEMYAQLVERYQRQIFNLMYRYCRADADAADLTQDIFLRAYAKLKTYRFSGSFFSWIYAMAVHLATDWSRQQTVRRKKLQLLSVMPVKTENSDKFAGQLEQQEELSQLEHALTKLPDMTREILFLRYKDECSIREVADIFSCSESAAKMRILRGIQKLRELMQEHND